MCIVVRVQTLLGNIEASIQHIIDIRNSGGDITKEDFGVVVSLAVNKQNAYAEADRIEEAVALTIVPDI